MPEIARTAADAKPDPIQITGISSMATRQVLAELTTAFSERSGHTVAIESVGGIDAAKRVQAGEEFDVVILASDAIDKLIAAGAIAPDAISLSIASEARITTSNASPACTRLAASTPPTDSIATLWPDLCENEFVNSART